MYQAVHGDRSGRIFVAADYGAAALDGGVAALERAIALPVGAPVVPLPDRAGLGLDRRALPRSLGPARLAVAAILGRGYVRTHLPAIDAAGDTAPLEPLPYAAIAADARGELVVAAIRLSEDPVSAPVDAVGAAISRRLRDEPSNRLLRQLARCAREYGCAAARNAFLGRDECALPLGAPANDDAAPLVALRRREERAPLAPIAIKVPAADAIAVAVAHLGSGGTSVSFGHACEGEPLGVIRDVAEVTAGIRAAGSTGEIVLRTSGSSAIGLGRAAEAGVDRVAVRIASADGPMYERVHRPNGFRWTDVRATLREAVTRRLAITVDLLALPGLTDRASEVGALLELLGELPPGTEVRLADLAADPYALLARLPAGATIGIATVLDRLRADAAHVRLAA